jgi:hypothetical protein
MLLPLIYGVSYKQIGEKIYRDYTCKGSD